MDVFLAGVVILVALGVFALLALGGYLVVRDTRRGRGRWGLNPGGAICKECGTPAPPVRVPASWRQMLWGGWTCSRCGLELDKWGEPEPGQPRPPKRPLPVGQDAAAPFRPAPRPGPSTHTTDQPPRGDDHVRP